jgi:hypothetical protein
VNIDDVENYLRTKQVPLNPVRNRGRLLLDINDFTGGTDVPNADDVARLAREIQQECDRDGLRWWNIKPEDSKLDVEAFARDIQKSLGFNYSRAQQILEILGKVDGGVDPPMPTPTKIGGFWVTYPGHDLAIDAYLGYTPEQIQWGPHHGIPLIAPADVIVERYAFPTPLNVYAAMDEQTRQNHRDLFSEWVCGVSDVVVPASHVQLVGVIYDKPLRVNDEWWAYDVEPTQVMNVAVARFVTSFTIDGVILNHIHLGHVYQDITVGRVPKNTQFGKSWDSGIRWEPRIDARAAHVHTVASTIPTLSPNGNISGVYAARAMGWEVEYSALQVGPYQYELGTYCAGKLRTMFTGVGKPLPPVPA